MDDPAAICILKQTVITPVHKVTPYLRPGEILPVDTNRFFHQDAGIPGDILPKYLCPVILHQAIVRRCFHLVVVLESGTVDVINAGRDGQQGEYDQNAKRGEMFFVVFHNGY